MYGFHGGFKEKTTLVGPMLEQLVLACHTHTIDQKQKQKNKKQKNKKKKKKTKKKKNKKKREEKKKSILVSPSAVDSRKQHKDMNNVECFCNFCLSSGEKLEVKEKHCF